MSIIRFILSGDKHQHFSEEEHGADWQDKADRFHRIHEPDVVSRDHLTKQTMQLVSMSTESATLVTTDGRTVTVTEGQPVSITPQDIQPVEEAPVETPEAPVEVTTPDETPDAPVSGSDTPVDPAQAT